MLLSRGFCGILEEKNFCWRSFYACHCSVYFVLADFANLERDIHNIEANGADWVHVDVMDGIFVPNISIGIPVVKALRPVTSLPLDVH